MMKRSFMIGEEWLYYKIYCGQQMADRLLIDVIKPVIKKLKSKKYIDYWFFIRYSDPHPHLRIRLHLSELDSLGKIIVIIQKELTPYVNGDLIWKVQTDTYQRELERYGWETIELSEQLFYEDSIVCLEALCFIQEDKSLFFFGLCSLDKLLGAFELSLEDKIVFSKTKIDAFKKEFHSDKTFNKQLVNKYNGLKNEAHAFLKNSTPEEYLPLYDLLKQKELKIKPIINQINTIIGKAQADVVKIDILSSYNHMIINRLFRNNQRLYELLSYQFLYKYYLSVKSLAPKS